MKSVSVEPLGGRYIVKLDGHVVAIRYDKESAEDYARELRVQQEQQEKEKGGAA